MTRTMSPALSLSDVLTHRARAYPERPALSDGVRALDYRALHLTADRVAVRLHELGVVPGDRVAIAGPRDARVCALLYGVLRSGAAAVAIDPTWSAADVRRRLDSVDARCVLVADASLPVPEGRPVEILDVDAPDPAPRPFGPPVLAPAAPAYLSFTSGSSGEPKAVTVTHANAVHYALSLRARLGLGEDEAPCCAHVTTLAADLGHTAWLLALATGGSVHVVPDHETREPAAFWASLAGAGVSVLKTTPSHLTALAEGRPDGSPPLRTLLLGGEALPRSLAAGLLDTGVARQVVNHYGPTETTIGATCFVASSSSELPADEPTVPIGTAIGEVVLDLVGPDGTPVPEEGELLIGGRGVTAGYFGRPEETARRFVPHRDGIGYLTGDLCRRRPEGDLVFAGRTDRQVKIRGHRVDPADVEWVMGDLSGVDQAAVVVRRTPSGARLAAAVRPGPGLDPERLLAELRVHLTDRLPEYSIPRPIVALTGFPTGPNGKLDHERLAVLVDEAAAREHEPEPSVRATEPSPSPERLPLVEAVTELWAGALGLSHVAPDSDVLSLGGDSILAMRTITLLRRHGYRVAFEDFYRSPSPLLLASVARPVTGEGVSAGAERDTADALALAPAQRWFFRQEAREPRHWNQAILLECGVPVAPSALVRAVGTVLTRHVALRRPIGPDGPGAPREVEDLDTVTFSRLPHDPEHAAERVEATCAELQHALDPAAGLSLRVHLFSGRDGVPDRLALIAHHLTVDGLSWRILLDDLAHAYRAALSGDTALPPPTADFHRWAATAPPAPADPPVRPEALAGTEPAALTWSLDAGATDRLLHRHGRSQRLEALLLSAFAHAVSTRDGGEALTVEVETHGRDTTDRGDAYMDTVGWFTAVKHVAVDGARPTAETVEETERRLREAPERPMDAAGPRPEVGFNLLGSFTLPDEPTLRWSVASESPGPARCPSADPLHRLRLTARVVEGRLVIDLVYAWPWLSHDAAEEIVAALGRTVAAEAEAPAPAPIPNAVPPSGHLLHPGLPSPARARVLEPPPHVLLTGATGYLGRHLVTALLDRGSRVTCLVRGRDDADAARRLAERTGAPVGSEGALDVIAGDIDLEGLGLGGDGLALARRAEVIVHAAADVRLVAPPEELERTNDLAVRRLVAWIEKEAPDARLHHLSTLAVAGRIDGPPRRFSEADLRIDQDFRTPYERTKFAAEETVRAWAAGGRPYHVHRSGHIAAHSRTGAFQDNVADNRIYQLVRGYVLAGAAPSRPSEGFAFSHVDTVAEGIAAIATRAHSAPGVHHVESPHTVAHDELVSWLVDLGYPITLTDDHGFTEALSRLERSDPTAARLAMAWSQLEDRNVVVDGSRTTSTLERAGVRFAPPTRTWWSAAMAWAVDVGFLPRPGDPRP
ncbi:AMP-binding protein [Nocardiopsis sp. LDBS1602]|uniref:AMP-binding protein n=1 Tax=Nocardiopsis sp. LDBS1602 TaxID=3109597 RepID=UPI002DBC2168|nr:AMP-binding protein [Nocardiopsis sp. LDBS1602]MEC3890988.1 AMP-binding protein [Nocardiopsis sp. LDBS1602]